MDLPIRLTYATAAVAVALDAGLEYGFDIAGATGLRRGTVYPILRRMEESGLISGSWESPARPRAEGRPARRYYRLTAAGRRLAAAAAARFPMLTGLVAAGGSRGR